MLKADEIRGAVEALLFMGTDPLKLKDIVDVLGITKEEVKDSLDKIKKEYQGADKGIELVTVNKGYQLQTKEQYQPFIKELHKPEMNNSLSQAALETLTIVAYKQPITRAEVEAIRGVNVEKALKTLQKRGLIKEKGKKDTIGNPIIYGTTDQFLEYMGLNDLKDLPLPQEFTQLHEEELEEEVFKK
ncbi:SMC-Scp complex subunit ScpB [Halonatronum saccharophilum]|uniref:SMC-Scp complex subunit ScpB n=1 Tax=Halonatronum saccharophilum TaxID=150060 RepID=UPI00048880BA|nr:SMC-Scp complex subunit ScpB [Halonatronum saccharophilum]